MFLQEHVTVESRVGSGMEYDKVLNDFVAKHLVKSGHQVQLREILQSCSGSDEQCSCASTIDVAENRSVATAAKSVSSKKLSCMTIFFIKKCVVCTK